MKCPYCGEARDINENQKSFRCNFCRMRFPKDRIIHPRGSLFKEKEDSKD